MKQAEFELYKLAYDLALQQAPDIGNLNDYSATVEKHLGMFSETLRKAMTPLQVLLTADKEKDMFGYKRADLDEELEIFLGMEKRVNDVAMDIKNFRGYVCFHREAMRRKLENVEVKE